MTDQRPLHTILAELAIARPAPELAALALDLVPDCLGIGIVDTAARADEALEAFVSVGDYPVSLQDMLAIVLHEMISGAPSSLLEAWSADYGRDRQVVDALRFETGPIAHYAYRLDSDPTLVLVAVVPISTNPRSVMNQVERLVGTAVVG